MKRPLLNIFFIAFFFLLSIQLHAQSPQVVSNGETTTPINFPGSCTYNWTNSNPSIGLPASGTGNIPSFTAVNSGNNPITANITATPVLNAAPAYAYIASASNGEIDVVNVATDEAIDKIYLPSNAGTWSVVASPDGNFIYTANANNNTISVINTVTNQVTNVITGITFPTGMTISPDGNFLYTSNFTPCTVSVINTVTEKLVKTINVGKDPMGVCISPDGKTLYVANRDAGTISIINTTTYLVTSTITLPDKDAWNVALSPDGKFLYVSSYTLLVINTTDNSIAANITVGYAPIGIAVSADGSKIYVTNGNSNNVSVISTAKNVVLTTIPVETQPQGIALSPDGNKLYVENYRSSDVSVINTETNLVSKIIPTEPFPTFFGNFISYSNNCKPLTFTITVNPPPTITTTTPTGTISACVGTPSANTNIQQFTVSGADLTGDITVTAPAGFEVAPNIIGTYSNSLIFPQTNGSVTNGVIYVRSAATAPAGNISNENVILSSPGTTDQAVPLSGTIYSSPSASTTGSQTKTNGQATDPVIFTGNATTYTWINNNTTIGLMASGTGDIPSFTAINNTGSPIIATITVTPLNDLNCAGQSQEFNITVDPSPTILSVAGALTPLTTVYGTPSASESFTVSCTTIGSEILVTPPTGFEVSRDGITFSNSTTITVKLNNSPIPVYIRLASSTPVGNNYNGNVIMSTANAGSTQISIPVSTVTPAPLTITADYKTKLYGTANPPLTVSYSGFVNNDGPAQLTALPEVSTTATNSSAAGQYPIIAYGAASPDYTFSYIDGILTITPLLSLQYIPNTFTPNGDNINDTWVIKGLDDYPRSTVNIFNRWGQQLYSSMGYPIPWDGTFQGKPLPSGTYYYIINLKNGQAAIAGSVAIIR